MLLSGAGMRDVNVSLEQSKEALAVLPAFIFLVDESLLLRFISDRAREILVGGLFTDRYVETALGKATDVSAALKDVFRDGMSRECQMKLCFDSGQERSFRGRIFLWGRDSGSSRLLAMIFLEEVTEYERAERELRVERERFYQYVQLAGVIFVVIDINEKVILINRKGCEILGCSEKEVIGQNWFDKFLPKGLRKHIRDDFHRMITGEMPPFESYENPVLRQDNKEERLLRWRNTLLRDKNGDVIASLSSGEDITEYRRLEKNLKEREEKYRNIFNNAQVGIFRTRISDGKLLECNPALAKMMGYDSAQDCLSGFKPAGAYAPPSSRGDFLRAIAKTGEVKDFEASFFRKDGKITHVSFAARIYKQQGFIEGSLIDITAKKESEMVLREQTKLLQDKNSALKEVLAHIEDEKSAIRYSVSANVDNILRPVLSKLRMKGGSKKYVFMLENGLDDLTSGFGTRLINLESRLTRREVEICQAVKSGMSSKDISQLLNISVSTVLRHRNNIRSKLRLVGKEDNLSSYLKNIS